MNKQQTKQDYPLRLITSTIYCHYLTKARSRCGTYLDQQAVEAYLGMHFEDLSQLTPARRKHGQKAGVQHLRDVHCALSHYD